MSELYPDIADVALNYFMMTSSTCLYEQGFATLFNMKTKHRTWLNVEHDLRVCLTYIDPRIDKLVCIKQAQY